MLNYQRVYSGSDSDPWGPSSPCFFFKNSARVVNIVTSLMAVMDIFLGYNGDNHRDIQGYQ